MGEGEARGLISTDGLAAAAWAHAAHGGQRPRSDDWRTWVFLGGRGAEWVWETAQALGPGGRIALVGPTMHDARTVMVEGPSGLLRLPFRAGARFTPSLRRVVFPGGAVGLLFSAEEPERLRGPQFHAAWGDEFCAWARGEEVLAMLRLGLRLGKETLLGRANSCGAAVVDPQWDLGGSPDPTRPGAFSAAQAASDRVASGSPPRLVLTSTPKPGPVLRGVLGEAGCVRTDAPTRANAANLAPGFLAAMEGLCGGTRRAAQELEGLVVEIEGGLFTAAMLAAARGAGPAGFDRVVVGVVPTASVTGDACGLVVAGRRRRADGTREAWVLADRSAAGLTPEGWARRALAAARDFAADAIVAEVNQGGDMVKAVFRAARAAGEGPPLKTVRAAEGKRARAEPVAALYEQGRVRHAGPFPQLEEELMALGGEDEGRMSLDRADALVWAVSALMLNGDGHGPSIRAL